MKGRTPVAAMALGSARVGSARPFPCRGPAAAAPPPGLFLLAAFAQPLTQPFARRPNRRRGEGRGGGGEKIAPKKSHPGAGPIGAPWAARCDVIPPLLTLSERAVLKEGGTPRQVHAERPCSAAPLPEPRFLLLPAGRRRAFQCYVETEHALKKHRNLRSCLSPN